jgi:hypothetical protein
MEKVVKKALGYGKPKENEDYTHVILTESEYNKNTNKIRDLEDDIKKLEREYNAAIERYKRSAIDKITEIQTKADKRVAEANVYRDIADRFENLNKNLIRVAVERANAQRGLTPKKQHIGYVFLSVEEYIFNCECAIPHTKKTKMLKLPCFKFRLQSPYKVNFDLDSVKNLICDDILKKLCKKFEVNSVYEKGIVGYTEDVISKLWNRDENFIFKISYKANFQKGFWEFECLTRDMVVVPTEMI